jgi:hypothetical protein
MKKILLLLIVLTSVITNGQTIQRLIGSSPFQDSLWVMDTVSFTTIHRRLGPVITGSMVTGMTALTKHPTNGRIYIVCKVSGTSGRVLGKLNLATGIISVVGNFGAGGNFSSITFKGDTLFGATGNGATAPYIPESLYRIDTTNATTTFLKTMGNGADGEIICYNPFDNFIYHWSGNSTTVIFEKLQSIAPYSVTSIATTTTSETFGVVNISATRFITSNISSTFNRYNVNGSTTANFGTAPDDLRGLAIINCSRAITGTPAYCIGDSTQLTAVAGTNYQWYKNGVAIPSATNQSVFVKTVGKYNCLLRDAVCGRDSTPTGITVIQNALPVVTVSGATTACVGSSITLTGPGAGGGTNQWYKNGVPIPLATSNTLIVTASGVYNMIKTNTNGCKDSAAVGKVVVIKPLPVITVNNGTVCAGASHTFSPNGAVSYTYTGGSAIVSPTITSNYTVTGTSSLSCIGTATASVLVNALPTITAVSNTSLICAGQSASLTASGAASYTWNTAATSAVIVVSPSITTTYTINGTNSVGCSNVTTITQNVSACTGLTNLSNTTQDIVQIYPNPTKDILNVELKTSNETVRIVLTNALGQVVSLTKVTSLNTTIDLSTQAKGIYFLQVVNNGETISTKKVIKE